MNKDDKGKVLYVGSRRSGQITTIIPTDVKFVRFDEIHLNKDGTIDHVEAQMILRAGRLPVENGGTYDKGKNHEND
jgi:hypothetical protein